MKKKEIKKILFIRVGAIGDIVHTLNAPCAIKELYPDVDDIFKKVCEILG